ncbi:MAG TPA: response regulator transcription factor [Gallionella sp.]|nr:response regulator transcription factor [Gallionella sp.]
MGEIGIKLPSSIGVRKNEGGSAMQIRLMFSHELELLRSCVSQLFQADPDIVVVAEEPCGEAPDSTELLHKLQVAKIDVLLLGMTMRSVHEAEVIARIRSAHPDLPVLVLGMDAAPLTVLQVMRAGASGFITMHCTPHVLLDAIHKVAAAGRYLDPEMDEKLQFATTSPEPSEPVSTNKADIYSELQWALSHAGFSRRPDLAYPSAAREF